MVRAAHRRNGAQQHQRADVEQPAQPGKNKLVITISSAGVLMIICTSLWLLAEKYA